MTKEEREAFDWFCNKFKKLPSYKKHHKNLRRALMNDYGLINVDRYKKLREGEREDYKKILWKILI